MPSFPKNSVFLSLFLILGLGYLSANISGQVKDANQNPLDQVEIFWEERNQSFSTDPQGRFSIPEANQEGIYFLDFKKTGYQNKVVTVELTSSSPKKISVTLSRLKTLRAVKAKRRSLQNLTERKGVSSTQIDSDTIKKIKLSKTEDLSALSANLFSISTGASFTSSFSLRGMGSVHSLEPIVGMYIDGVAQFQSYNYPTLLGNISSIEVLKGPQSTLYGRNAIAGVIDIKTQTPPNRFSIRASAELGSGRNLKFGSQTYDLYFSVPILEDHFYLKMGGFYHRFNGFFYNDYLKKPAGGEENYSVYLKTDALTSYFDFFWRAKFEKLNESSFPYHSDKERANQSPYRIDHDKEGLNQKTSVDTNLRFLVPLRYFDLDLITTYQYFKGVIDLDLDFTSSKALTLDSEFNQHLVTSENKIVSQGDSEKYFSWSVGTYFYYQSRKIQSDLYSALGNQKNQLGSDDQTLGAALFASLTLPLPENVFLIFGARGEADHKNAKVNKKINESQEPEKPVDETIFVASPKLAVNYYPITNILLYLSASRGFRSGGVNFFTSEISKIYYGPEYTWNADLGMKNQFLIDNRVGQANLSTFYIYWTDQQVNVYLPEGDNLFEFGVINAGSSHNLGVEIETKIPFYWGLAVGGNYGYVYSKYLDFKVKNTSGKKVDVSGNTQAFVPQHTVSTFLEHEFKFELLSIRDSLVNRFDFKYLSQHYFDVENRYSQPGYYLLNYTFNFNIAGVICTFWIKNILNHRYYAFALPSAGSFLRVKVGDPFSMGGKFALYF